MPSAAPANQLRTGALPPSDEAWLQERGAVFAHMGADGVLEFSARQICAALTDAVRDLSPAQLCAPALELSLELELK